MIKKLLTIFAFLGAATLGAPVWAQDAAPAASTSVEAPVAADPSEETILVTEETVSTDAAAEEEEAKLDTGNTAWMLASTMLVILMTIPGLALFYGGLARTKNMLSVLMHVFVIFSLTTILWCVYGYSLAFSGDGQVIGNLDKLFLQGITPDSLNGSMPEYVWVAFQSTFAAITTALIVGAYAERIRFLAVVLFSILWFTFSYVPMAHIVWGNGFLGADKAMDFAGGTVVHINAGIAGLVGAYLLGKRLGFGREAFTPHSLTLTMVGATLLWVGWFGFNAGSAAAADGIAGLAFVNTILATGAAVLSWIAAEAVVKGKPSMLGAASGAVAGLVAITPAAGFIGPMGAIVLGLLAGVVCLWGVNGLKKLLNVDDAFDVFGVHGIGGILGAVLTGVFAAPSLGGLGNTLLDDPASMTIAGQVATQVKSVLVTIVWSGVVSLIAYKLVDLFVGLRVPEDQEREGLDITAHGETAYHY
ncbi:MAG: ammonium transporter [Zoogloeaceae bacterium]|jgi:Amt family ammonium transporter|nr:ammonium transporter [Zoogloeaceae bacterium]